MAATRRLGRPLMVPRSFLTISPSRVRAESRARALGQAAQKQARSWCWLSATFAGTSPLQCMMVGEGQGQAGKSRKWARREEERARLDWEAQRLQPLPQQNRPASLWLGSGRKLFPSLGSTFVQVRAPAVIAGSQASFSLFPVIFSC